MLEGRSAIQRDLDGLEEWDDRNLMKSSKDKLQSPVPEEEESLAVIQAGD